MTPDNPHQLLGVAPDASPVEVKRAFRKLALAMHPDVSDDPAHVELFKRIIMAYDSVLGGVAEPASADIEVPGVDLFHFWQRCRVAVEKLRWVADREEQLDQQWAASADRVAADVLDQASTAFVLTFREPDDPAFREAGHVWIETRPLLFDDAKRFLHGSLHLLAKPDERLEANLVRGALGAVGLSRVVTVVGRGANPVDKELFARAVMSALAAALVEEQLIDGTIHALGFLS